MFPEPTELLLFGRINLDPKIEIKYIRTENQLADMSTKGNFTRDEWNHLLSLFNISHFISTSCSEVMPKRKQKNSGDERVTTKSEPMMNEFGFAMQRQDSRQAIFCCIRTSGEDQKRKSKSYEFVN